MKLFKPEFRPLTIGFGVTAIILIAGAVYGIIRMNSLSNRIDTLTMNVSSLATIFASTTEELKTSIDKNHSALAQALTAEQQNVGTIQQQLGSFKNQVGTITGTVDNLQKLSKTDPELLKKYSKVYFLSENYVPARLAEIPNQYSYSSTKTLLFQTDSLPHLEDMIKAASSTGVTIYALSAYRSFDEQKALKGDYAMTYGAGTANSFSADQGYSEHQLGTATDLITPGLGGQLDDRFDGTMAYQWLQGNAYKYGFVLSYPKGNTYYVYEPWHWRFVGIKLATDLHNQGKNFYDLDQRKIDEYLVSLFD